MDQPERMMREEDSPPRGAGNRDVRSKSEALDPQERPLRGVGVDSERGEEDEGVGI